jgi:hypothetical protein
MITETDLTPELLDEEWEFVRAHLPASDSESRELAAVIVAALRAPELIPTAPQWSLDLLTEWCQSESAREALCLMANTAPGRKLLEISDGGSLGQVVGAHAPNHPQLCVRQLGGNLFAIEAVARV